MSHTLIVLPDDTAKPILDALDAAKRSLNIRMFLFTDPTLIEAVIAAHHRGVKVRVMLNPARRSGEEENKESRQTLAAAGIDVPDSNPALRPHAPEIDGDRRRDRLRRIAQLGDARSDGDARLRGRDDEEPEVTEMVACFDADWARHEFDPHPDSRLIWCPNNGRDRIAAFIDSAKKTLWLQNERYQDTVIIERLVRAANRGVTHPHPRPAAAHAEDGEAGRGRRRPAHHARRRREDPQAEGPQAPREDDPGRRASAPSWARSISRRAVSTRGASWRSRSTAITSSSG